MLNLLGKKKEEEKEPVVKGNKELVLETQLKADKNFMYFCSNSPEGNIIICRTKRLYRGGRKKSIDISSMVHMSPKREHAHPEELNWVLSEMKKWKSEYNTVRGFSQAYHKLFIHKFSSTLTISQFQKMCGRTAYRNGLSTPRGMNTLPPRENPMLVALKKQADNIQEQIKNMS